MREEGIREKREKTGMVGRGKRGEREGKGGGISASCG